MTKTKLTKTEDQILKLLTEKDDLIIKQRLWLKTKNLKIIQLENQIKKLKEENK